MKTKKTIFLLAGLMYFRQMDKTLTFREITTCDELEKAFRFRYEEYSKCRLNVFLQHNEHKLDIDLYDLHSRHYGLFTGDNDMIGYLRVVLDKREYQNTSVMEIVSGYGFFNKLDKSSKPDEYSDIPDYPFLSYEKIPDEILQFYQGLKNKKEKVLEASRLILKEGHRGLKTISFLVECVISLYPVVYSGYKYVVADCVKEHAVFYKRYCFLTIYHLSGCNLYEMKRMTTWLSLDLSSVNVPFQLHLRFKDMALEYGQTGRITRYSV